MSGRQTPLRISPKGLKLLKSMEGLRSKPYDDQTGDPITSWQKGATIGYGHLIAKSEWHKYENGITEKEATALLRRDVKPYISAVQNNVKASLSQEQFDALVLFVFNIGKSGFRRSSLLKLINNANAKTPYKNLESAWKAWKKSQGKVMKGLKRRRKTEWKLYSQGVYQTW